ncbi:simple sugar transport system permease protein [Cetobacterium ceti]|uniref:Simple sugar transport system permease protein n=1 Tax=Cetobacterium ceti TaxID=180163 RepID=A0A1T4MGR5_9FUSO|nr:ABC transporter permease [Cetobacterium ceti]SJZ65954.1 simple sugar transport system permease protein [Cetobacterium ceti]
MKKIHSLMEDNLVPLIIFIFLLVTIPLSKLSPSYLIQEIILRLDRNLFLVLSLLVPIIAGMGLNFGIVLGAMGGQIALIFISEWRIVGIEGIILAFILSTPLSILLGWISGEILNRAKGREMITSMILGLFMNGVYQLLVLYGMGNIIKINNPKLILSRGSGIRNAIDLNGIRQGLDKILEIKINNISIPIGTFILVFILCFFILWFRKTKLGQDMRALGENMEISRSAGIPVERTRIVAIIISTILAGYGQIIYLQNIGTMNTYNSHEQIGMFSIAALLIGGASAARATITNGVIGVILFHLMFIVSPMAGKELVGSAQIGEYFRVFVSYGIIALVLVLHQLKRDRLRKVKRSEI